MKRALFFSSLLAFGCVACAPKEDPNRITASGTIEATDVNVAAKLPAQVVAMNVDEGKSVATGDLIATLDHSSLDIQLREAQAAVDAARAQLRLTEKGARVEDIRSAESAVQQAQANRKLAAEELERIRTLVKGQAATREQLDQAEARYRVAQSQLEQAEQGAEKSKHFVRPEEISMASARLDQLIATRDRVQKMIDDCFITSPTNGVVTHKVVESGELVGQGATIASIIDMSKVHLMIYVSESDLARVHLGQQVQVTIDGAANKTFMGKVVYISPEAEFTPKNIQTKDDRIKLVFGVKVEIDNASGALKKGLPADAAIVVK